MPPWQLNLTFLLHHLYLFLFAFSTQFDDMKSCVIKLKCACSYTSKVLCTKSTEKSNNAQIDKLFSIFFAVFKFSLSFVNYLIYVRLFVYCIYYFWRNNIFQISFSIIFMKSLFIEGRLKSILTYNKIYSTYVLVLSR